MNLCQKRKKFERRKKGSGAKGVNRPEDCAEKRTDEKKRGKDVQAKASEVSPTFTLLSGNRRPETEKEHPRPVGGVHQY